MAKVIGLKESIAEWEIEEKDLVLFNHRNYPYYTLAVAKGPLIDYNLDHLEQFSSHILLIDAKDITEETPLRYFEPSTNFIEFGYPVSGKPNIGFYTNPEEIGYFSLKSGFAGIDNVIEGLQGSDIEYIRKVYAPLVSQGYLRTERNRLGRMIEGTRFENLLLPKLRFRQPLFSEMMEYNKKLSLY